MRRLAWTFTARIGDKYQIRLTQSKLSGPGIMVRASVPKDNPFLYLFAFYSQARLFHYFEPSQSLGGAETDFREKPPDHPQAELGLSHVTWAT